MNDLKISTTPGLYERWLSIERASGRSMTDILADLNAVAGTNYKHNWPSVVAGRGYELERCPVAVRRYMMTKVLADELSGLGKEIPKNQLEKLIIALT
ncbi:4-aminobutyrate aminotransferase-like enzyme [Undibacterium sp. GrIS 1.2]